MISLSFLEPKFKRRIERSPFEKDLLRDALGRGSEIRILDATAGLCRDALRMAYWGHHVIACEKNHAIAQAILYAHNEASTHDFYSPWISRLAIIPLSVEDYIAKAPDESFDVVIIDPMFPDEKRKGLPKKDLQFLKENVAGDDNAEELLNFCLNLNTKKILLKRPLKAPHIVRKPTHAYRGRAHRWDVYVL